MTATAGEAAPSPCLDLSFAITYFDGAAASHKREEQISLATLAGRIRNRSARQKDDLPWLKLARFGEVRTDHNCLRHDLNVLAISGVELDYDLGEMPFERAADVLLKGGVLSLLYTSPSHADAKPRWRVLCPTSCEMHPDRRTHLLGRLNGLLGGVASGESWTLSQSYFYGRVGDNPAHRVELIEGEPIDQLDELDEIWRGKPNTGPTVTAAGQPRSGPIDEPALLTEISEGRNYHVASMRLLGRWARDGVPLMAARQKLVDAMERVPRAIRDTRWHSRFGDIDRCIDHVYIRQAGTRDAIATSGGRSAAQGVGRVGAVLSHVPTHTLGALLDDNSPMPDDLIGPRLLTPGGLLVLGGAPKVGKSDFLINLLVHAAAGVPFLRFVPSRPLRIFYLQAEIQYHYLRERLQQLRSNPDALMLARDNLVVTPKLRMLLNEQGLALTAAAVRRHFPHEPPDIMCVDPIRNLFDGGPDGKGESDNTAMLFFLQERLEVLREDVAPNAGLIACHHTRKLAKKQLLEDPFMALSGASALRSFYSTGMILFRPDETRSERHLEIELRNGPALQRMIIDKRGGRWVERDVGEQRLVREAIGAQLDAERVRRRDVILDCIAEQALAGNLYTTQSFSEAFENHAGLGGADTIRRRITALATQGHLRYLRDGTAYGLAATSSKFGYLVVEDMTIPGRDGCVDPETGEISGGSVRVLPSHYRCPHTGALLPLENPEIWVPHDGGELNGAETAI